MAVAYILCVTEVGKEKDVQAKLKEFNEVKEVYVVYITEKIRGIGHIQMTSTMIAL
jgi:hypothetical protein